jgi:hypothetical protein
MICMYLCRSCRQTRLLGWSPAVVPGLRMGREHQRDGLLGWIPVGAASRTPCKQDTALGTRCAHCTAIRIALGWPRYSISMQPLQQPRTIRKTPPGHPRHRTTSCSPKRTAFCAAQHRYLPLWMTHQLPPSWSRALAFLRAPAFTEKMPEGAPTRALHICDVKGLLYLAT